MQFVTPMPFQEAIDKLGEKTIVTSTLNSQEWSTIPVGLRDRAFFSATIENARFLQTSRDFISDFLSNSRETLENGKVALSAGSRAQFVKELSEFAQSQGMGPLDPDDAGTLKDITSQTRLSLIFNTQVQAAEDYGYWKQGMDPDLLDEFPAQRFIRVMDVKSPRIIHAQNENVVRLKTDLNFWLGMNSPAIGGFGVPWGPWGFNSGMGVEDVDRTEAEATHLISPGQKLQPIEKDLNDHLEASTTGLDEDIVNGLKQAFGNQVEFDEQTETVRWTGQPATIKPDKEPVAPSKPSAPAPEKETFEGVLKRIGISTDKTVTAENIVNLISEAKESDPVKLSEVITKITGKSKGSLSEKLITSYAQEFLDFLPRSVVEQLPKLTIEVQRLTSALGDYANGVIRLSSEYLGGEAPEQVKKTLFHEMMHWFHRDGTQAYRDAITNHFAERTAGEKLVQLPGYSGKGKLDHWYETYAGKIYSWEATPGGLEMPTRYIEWLTKDPSMLADRWNNDPYFRDTFLLVMKGLFQ